MAQKKKRKIKRRKENELQRKMWHWIFSCECGAYKFRVCVWQKYVWFDLFCTFILEITSYMNLVMRFFFPEMEKYWTFSFSFVFWFYKFCRKQRKKTNKNRKNYEKWQIVQCFGYWNSYVKYKHVCVFLWGSVCVCVFVFFYVLISALHVYDVFLWDSTWYYFVVCSLRYMLLYKFI